MKNFLAVACCVQILESMTSQFTCHRHESHLGFSLFVPCCKISFWCDDKSAAGCEFDITFTPTKSNFNLTVCLPFRHLITGKLLSGSARGLYKFWRINKRNNKSPERWREEPVALHNNEKLGCLLTVKRQLPYSYLYRRSSERAEVPQPEQCYSYSVI